MKKFLFLFVCVMAICSIWAGDTSIAYRRLGSDGNFVVASVKKNFDVLYWQKYDWFGKSWIDVQAVRQFEVGKGQVFEFPKIDRTSQKGSKTINTKWRLVGRSASGDFPSGFFAGATSFEGEIEPPVLIAKIYYAMGCFTTSSDLGGGDTDPEPTPLESDIWKIDGSTIYYFNSLRGLQVIDASNPAAPVVSCALRLVGSGQNLFVRPLTGPVPKGDGDISYSGVSPDPSVREVILITNTASLDTEVLRLIVRDGQAQIASRTLCEGAVVDSRLIGNQLVLVVQDYVYGSPRAYWQAVTRIFSLDLTDGGTAVLVSEFEGSGPVVSAGAGWLSVTTTPPSTWNYSEVRVFRPQGNSLVPLAPGTIQVAGTVADQFKMSVSGDILSIVSQSWVGSTRKTVLENFRLGEGATTSAIGRLDLADGETLYATRFDGKRAYIVTFLQTDPLWVVDLSDPSAPSVSGHLEIPGWSTHIAPLGDGRLFSVGFLDGRVSAALFDVSNPASPQILSRLNLGQNWSSSEATSDEKAIKFLPERGLALVPYSTWNVKTGKQEHAVQIIQIGASDLTARGTISHQFVPRRAGSLDTAIASISGRELIIVDTADLDHPAVLADVSLAWNVNRALVHGDYLLEIEDGDTGAIRVATTSDPDTIADEYIFAESGRVVAAEIRNDLLYVVRSIYPWNSWGLLALEKAATTAKSKKLLDSGRFLEIYALDELPALRRISQTSLSLESVGWSEEAQIVWPSEETPVIVSRTRNDFYRIYKPMKQFTGDISISMVAPYYPQLYYSDCSVRLAAVDVSNPEKPIVSKTIAASLPNSLYASPAFATDGVVAIGFDTRGRAYSTKSGKIRFVTSEKVFSSLAVFDITKNAKIMARPLVQIPASLVAISDFTPRSALLWTQRQSSAVITAAYDGSRAYRIASQDVPSRTIAAVGRTLYAACPEGVASYELSNNATFTRKATWALGLQPNAIFATPTGGLLASSGNSLYSSTTFPETTGTWRASSYLPALPFISESESAFFVPLGTYGVETLLK